MTRHVTAWTRRRLALVVQLPVAAMLAASVVVTSPAVNASPATSGPTVSKKQDATWNGGTFTASSPTINSDPALFCGASGNDPTCDHFALNVDARPGTAVAVAITADMAGDDFDLGVYYPDGSLAGFRDTSGDEAVVFEHRSDRGAGAYDVRVRAEFVTVGSSYRGTAAVSRREPDPERECLEAAPAATALDLGQRISLDVVVLLDGVTPTDGRTVMTMAAEAYEPLNIELRVKRYLEVAFEDRGSLEGYIDQAKEMFGNRRPRGIDVVHVLQPKDYGGLADCIGGVRYPNRGFVASTYDPHDTVLSKGLNYSAGLAAHEIGHELGAHHHYANCVQAITPEAVLARELSACTVMFNSTDFVARTFSTLNAAIVRGHAVNYAAP